MVNAARASVNRATARFILRSRRWRIRRVGATARFILRPARRRRDGSAASKGSSPSPASANQSLAKHNRKPTQVVENKNQRPKSIASFCRAFAPGAPPDRSLPTTHAFLIASRQLLEIELTRSQQTRKHFLIASFSAISEIAPYLANHSSSIAPFLFAAVAHSFAHLSAFRVSPIPGRHGRIAAL